MNTPTTNASTSSASRPSVRELTLRQVVLLFGTGVLLAGFHQAWDFALGLPGHFGLVWMAGIVLARAGSTVRFAACCAALGYAGGDAAFSGAAIHALGQAPGYALGALVVDLAWQTRATLITRPAYAGLVGGLAFACKPLIVAALVALFEITAGSLRHGLGFPLLTHFCFGATGAVIGALLWQSAHALPRSRGA